VYMVQPSGNVQRDWSYSQTNQNNANANLTNSQAGLNWAQATAVVIDAQGNYVVNEGQADYLHAQACATRNDCGLQNYLQGQQDARASQTPAGLYLLGGVMFAFVVFLLWAKSKG
jgi:hypothetical protein